MNRLIACFRRDDCGATAVEYGLIGAFMSIAIAAAFPSISDAVATAFNNIGTNLVVN